MPHVRRVVRCTATLVYSPGMATLLTETTQIVLPDARVEGERLWLSAAELEAATGWSPRPEGLCRAGVCVPVPPAREHDLLRDDRVDVAAVWRHLDKPIVHSAD